MRLLLISVAQRLAGQGGDPVVQLQTAFGGGKTHTMLAVYHLAGRKVSTDKLEGIPPVLDEAGISQLPHANVAVLDGIKLSPSQPPEHDGLIVNTLWGELAWQLLGKAGYDKVAQADQDGTSPGKEAIVDLLHEASPCVVLIDELVAFARQLEIGKHYKAGTFDSNISFIQALTEVMKAVPDAILLASLPESDLEVGGNTVKFIENFQMTEILFESAMNAHARGCDELAKETGKALLSWTFKGGRYETGWDILERGLYGLSVLALRDDEEQVTELKSSITSHLSKETAPTEKVCDRTARNISERAAELHRQGHWSSSIERAIDHADHEKLQPLLEEIADLLLPTADDG